MRARIVLVVFLLLFTPVFFLYAAEDEGDSKKEDPKPAYEGNLDQCVSEKVSVKDEKLVTEKSAITTSEYKQCKEANDNKGCTAELEKDKKCMCGTVTYTVTPDGKPCVVSKCDPDAEGTAKKCVAEKGVSLPNLEARQDLENYIATTGKLPGWVEKAFTDEQLKTVQDRLTTDPASVADQIASLYYPRDNAEREAAAHELGITPEQLQKLATNSVRLTPEQQRQIVGGGANMFLGGVQYSTQQTFGDPAQTVALAPRGSPSALTYKNGSREVIDAKVLGYLASDAQRRVCASMRGACYVTTEAQFATMMNETNGDVRALGDGGRSASLAQVYATQSGFSALLAQYKAVYGEDYVLHRINIKDPSINPEWIASQSVRMQAIVLQDKAQAVGGSFARQVTSYNGSGPAAVAYGRRALNNAYLLQNGNAAGYWQSAFNTAKAGGGPSITNLSASDLPFTTGYSGFSNVGNYTGTFSGSPFGSVSPFSTFGGGTRNGINTVRPVGVTGSGATPGVGGIQSGGPSQQSGQTQKGTSSGTSTKSILERAKSAVKSLLDAINPPQVGQNTTAPVDPVATLYIQQQSIARGESIQISWSSLGMSTLIPCRVLVTSGTVTSLIAEGNDGSETVATNSSMPGGVWRFMLRCTAQKGGFLVDKEEEVTVE